MGHPKLLWAMPHSVIDIWQVLVTLPVSSPASKRFMANENRKQEGMQKKGDLSKEFPLVGALVAMPVGSYCLFGKVVTDVGTRWLLGTSHALWHILGFVQVVRILQKTHSPQVNSIEASESLAGTQQGWEAARAGGTAVLFDEERASWLWGTCISSLCKTKVISGGGKRRGGTVTCTRCINAAGWGKSTPYCCIKQLELSAMRSTGVMLIPVFSDF